MIYKLRLRTISILTGLFFYRQFLQKFYNRITGKIMRKFSLLCILTCLTISSISASDILSRAIFESDRTITNNPLLTDDENNNINEPLRTLARLDHEKYQNNPPFDTTKGSACWQGIKSYCADTKECCLTGNCCFHEELSNLPKPVAQCRECCLEAENGCAKPACVGTCLCLAAGLLGLTINGCVIP